jgi:hypothetical protein
MKLRISHAPIEPERTGVGAVTEKVSSRPCRDRRPIDKDADRVGRGAQLHLCSFLLQADDDASSVPCVSEWQGQAKEQSDQVL